MFLSFVWKILSIIVLALGQRFWISMFLRSHFQMISSLVAKKQRNFLCSINLKEECS